MQFKSAVLNVYKRRCSVHVLVCVIWIQNTIWNIIFNWVFFLFTTGLVSFLAETSPFKLYSHFSPQMYKMAALPSEGANMSLMWLFVWKYIFWKAFKKGLATLKGLSNHTYQISKYFPTNTRRMPYTRSYSSRNESSRFEIEEKTKSMWLK